MIGNGMQQAPPVRNTDVVGDWGTFASSDLESQYRQQQATYDTFQSKMFRAIIVAFVVVNILGGIIARQVHYWKRQQFVAMLRQTELRARLEQALAEIKTLRGILPICSHCKCVRDDTGYWQQVEVYVRDRT